ncbi:hypothetical protein NDU88_008146 [Pleurodeles waltl]|uniref:Uncharacterized protein n=1 Tax=Pleurodeles waltl TaxID=8319 RepID=A0AAV7VVJ2_PLEWA|nr:hypothetical protein NDU88_008146 [Pleurodeles waltl]
MRAYATWQRGGVSEGAKTRRSGGALGAVLLLLTASREPRITGSGETQPPVSLTLCTEPTPELTSQRHLPRLPQVANLAAPALPCLWAWCHGLPAAPSTIRHPLPVGLFLGGTLLPNLCQPCAAIQLFPPRAQEGW